MDPLRETVNSSSLMYELLFGYLKTEVLFSACDLKVFDGLAKGPASCTELAHTMEIPPLHLEKLLNTLCMMKLLTKTITEDKEVYENTVTTNMYLVRSSEKSLLDLVDFYRQFKDITGKMTKCIKKGGQVITKDDPNIFYMLENDPEFRRIFQGGMACISRTSHNLVKAFDLGQFDTHVDLGGGTGTFARKVAETYPDLDVTVCDLKRVCDTARDIPANQASRVKFVPGDFFKGELPKADVFSMCHVLHDWSDEDCNVILKHVYDHVNQDGGILILDSVFNDDKVGPIRVNLTEIGQIVQHDGKHRTKAEFEKMLNTHGFYDVELVRFEGFGFYDAIFARKRDA